MKSVTLVAIVLIAIAMIFSFSAVAADKPEDLPKNGPLNEISTMLSEILDSVTAIFGITQSLDANVSTLQTGMDANFTDVDSKLNEIQESLGSSNQEVIYHTNGHYLEEWEHLDISCRNTNTTAIGSVHAVEFKWDPDSREWIRSGSYTYNALGYQGFAHFYWAGIGSDWKMVEISVSSREIFCTVCFDDFCYLPNDFYVQYI